jgi:hypothetical protein
VTVLTTLASNFASTVFHRTFLQLQTHESRRQLTNSRVCVRTPPSQSNPPEGLRST